MLKIILLFCCFTLSAYNYKVSIATVFQNEGPYLKEWIEFHRLVGVEHFFLYNNNSEDEFRDVLAPYIEEGIVELIEWEERATSQIHWKAIQRKALIDATERGLGISEWIAYIDADEFIFPVKDKTIPEFLNSFSNFPAVSINWQVFGTSHVKCLKQNRLMIEQLVYRMQKSHVYNYFVKTIAKPEYVNLDASLARWNPHTIPLKPGHLIVNANKKPLKISKMDPSIPIERIRIHHYSFRDENFFFNVKLNRADANNEKTKLLKEHAKDANDVQDKSILIYAEELKKNLNSRP